MPQLLTIVVAVSLSAFADVEPETLDFGPFELASPTREARVKLGPDEPAAARRVEQNIPEKAAVRSRRASGMGFDGG